MFREDVSFDILELHAYVFKNSKSFMKGTRNRRHAGRSAAGGWLHKSGVVKEHAFAWKNEAQFLIWKFCC